MTTRKANSVADTVTTSTTSSTTTTNHQNQPRSRSPSSGVPCAEAAGGGAEMFGAFQDWCLRTYGDSGKTKTVTRRKYNKILQTLVQGDEENSNGVLLTRKATTTSTPNLNSGSSPRASRSGRCGTRRTGHRTDRCCTCPSRRRSSYTVLIPASAI
ncbi:Nucleolar protein 4 [Dissostichus eleginoides]|uniref:Nucleolar protein 4 n=1 Tax=Dissostichus eleginoides TaxID=100907 RepID=A0AAD9CCE5_DISEL|nr:Nucleolar protein 4 [Dissostichus eleginoides]